MRILLTLALAASLVLAFTVTATAAKPGAKLVQFKSGGYSVSENQTASIAIILSQKGTASVNFSTLGGSATASADAVCDPGEDYVTKTDEPVSFSNQTGKNVNLTICNDSSFENSETVAMELSDPSTGWSLGPKQTATLTIKDNDPSPTITIDDADPAAVNEGDSLTFDVHISGVSSVPTSVNYASANGTGPNAAIGPGDFGPANLPGVLSWGPGDTSDRQITVPANDDALDELQENMRVVLSSPINGSFGDATGVGLINDTDVVGINAVDPPNDNEDGAYVFSVTLDKVPAAPVSVNAFNRDDLDGATAGATCGPGIDYQTFNTTLNWAAGDGTAKTVTVVTCDDGESEPDEGIRLELGSAVGGVIGDDSGSGLLVNDDAAISVNDASGPEGDFPDDNFTVSFTVSLAHASIRTVTVDVATSDGSALGGTCGDPGVDYASLATTTLTFLPGETSKTVDVTTCGDLDGEGDETFNLDLTNPTTTEPPNAVAMITDATGVGTIQE